MAMPVQNTVRVFAAIISMVLLAGCGRRLSGVYAGHAELGMGVSSEISVEFSSSGTAFLYVEGTESAGKYRVEGQRVIVAMPTQNSVFTIVDDDTMTTTLPSGEVTLKRKP